MATSTTSKLHSSLFGLVIGGLVSLIIAALYLQGVFTAYEWKTRDLRQQHAAPRPIQSQDILILDIDEESIQRLRSQYAWPWPRQLHAYVVEYMTHARAKALVFDVLFVDKAAAMVDPDRLDPLVDELRRTAGALTSKDVMPDKATAELKKSIEALAALNQHNDEVLAKSIQAAGNVFLAMVFDPSGAPLAEPVAKQYGMPASALALKPIAGGLLPLLPVPKLLDASAGVGHINYVPDSDGILRAMQLGYEHERRLYPSLALRVAMCHLGVEPSGLVAARGESFRLTEDHKRLLLPVRSDGSMLINFRHTFRRVPYYEALSSAAQLAQGQAPLVPPQTFTGKTVMVGASAKGLLDLRATPVAAEKLGSEVQAQVLANLLNGDFLREAPRAVPLALIFACGILLGILLQRLGPVAGTALSLLALFAYCAAAVYAFRAFWLWLDVVAPCTAIVFCHIAVVAHKFTSVERQHFLEKQLVQQELRIAHDVQKSLMPLSDPIVPAADISGWNQPCDDTGGDYYDFVPLQDGRLAIALADVSGHGLGSALIMAAARSYLRAFVHADLSPGALLSRVNDLLCQDLGDGRFVTMFFCVFDPRTRGLTYASAGHEAPLILRAADGRVDSLPSTGFPLGVMPGGQYEDGPPTLLNSGDMLAILTDGVMEAMNRRQEQFGRQRLLDMLRQHLGRPAKEVIQSLHAAVQTFRGQVRQQDDITIIVAKGVESEAPLEEIVPEEAESLDEVVLEDDKG